MLGWQNSYQSRSDIVCCILYKPSKGKTVLMQMQYCQSNYHNWKFAMLGNGNKYWFSIVRVEMPMWKCCLWRQWCWWCHDTDRSCWSTGTRPRCRREAKSSHCYSKRSRSPSMDKKKKKQWSMITQQRHWQNKKDDDDAHGQCWLRSRLRLFGLNSQIQHKTSIFNIMVVVNCRKTHNWSWYGGIRAIISE